jgi:hypothetical protein
MTNDIDSIINEAAKFHGVNPELIRRVMRKESRGNSRAVSPKGASGLMQLMPETAKEMGVTDIFDIRQNIFGGTKYLAKQLKDFNNDEDLALAAYNAGPGAVRRAGGVPNYKETQDYVTLNDDMNVEEPMTPEEARRRNPDVKPLWTGDPSTGKTADPYNGWKPAPIDPRSPLGKKMGMEQPLGPDEVEYEAIDPETKEPVLIVAHKDDPEPTDEEVAQVIADQKASRNSNAQTGSAMSKGEYAPDSFKGRVAQQSEAAQTVEDPIEMISGMAKGIGSMGLGMLTGGMAGTNLFEGLIKPQVEAGMERAKPYVEQSNQAPDTTTKLMRAGQALLSLPPVVGPFVRPAEEDVHGRNPEGLLGSLVGVGVDAALAGFGPKALSTANTGAIKPAGRAMAESGAERFHRNIGLHDEPITKHLGRLLNRYSGPGLLASAVGLGIPFAKIAGLIEGARVINHSPTVAKYQSKLGSLLAQGTDTIPSKYDRLLAGANDLPPNRVPTAEETWMKEGFEEDFDAPPSQPFPDEYRNRPDPNAYSVEDIEDTYQAYPEFDSRSIDRQWEGKTDKPVGYQDDVGDLDFESLEEIARQEELARNPRPAQSVEESWVGKEDKPVGLQDTNEPVRNELPEIKGKEGKKIYGEDQNRVSRMAKRKKEAADELGVDESEITLEEEPDIVPDRDGKFKKVEDAPKKVITPDPNEPVLTFADFESGDRVTTTNGKTATLVRVEGNRAVVKLDSGQTVGIARKSIKKIETPKIGPDDVDELPESGSMRTSKPKMASGNTRTVNGFRVDHLNEGEGGVNYEVFAPDGYRFRSDETRSILAQTMKEVKERIKQGIVPDDVNKLDNVDDIGEPSRPKVEVRAGGTEFSGPDAGKLAMESRDITALQLKAMRQKMSPERAAEFERELARSKVTIGEAVKGKIGEPQSAGSYGLERQESALEKAAREGIDDIGDVDEFGNPQGSKKASGARVKVETKLRRAKDATNPNSTRDKLLNPRRTGQGLRQQGKSPRILREIEKAGVSFSPEEVRTVMETADKIVRAKTTPKKGMNIIDDGKKKVYAYYDGSGKLIAYGQADIKKGIITDRFKWTKGFEELDRKSLKKETRERATKASEEILDAMMNDGFEPPDLSHRSADAIKSWHRYKANRSESLKRIPRSNLGDVDDIPPKGSVRVNKPKMANRKPDLPEGVTLKRSKDFSTEGTYDITIDGETHQIYRDTSDGLGSWRFVPDKTLPADKSIGMREYLGFDKQEAINKITERVRKNKRNSIGDVDDPS